MAEDDVDAASTSTTALSAGPVGGEGGGALISDNQFMNDLNRLKELRSFLIQEAVSVDGPRLSFGELNYLRYSPKGRPPAPSEWDAVDRHTQECFRLLNEGLRKKFLLGEVPRFIAIAPIYLAATALVSLIMAVVIPALIFHIAGTAPFDGPIVLPFYLIWLVALGAIGAIAFIGMNILSVQQDITFDLTNNRLMLLRVVLGSLFGLVITMPFGFSGFLRFSRNIAQGATPIDSSITMEAALLLLPFVLGFSTSLVIMILNRLVDAVQAFFGKPTGNEKLVPQPGYAPVSVNKRTETRIT